MTRTKSPRCLWCEEPLDPPNSRTGQPRLYCNPAHRAAYKRAKKNCQTADIVQRLEPYVSEEGVFVYRELIEHLALKVNETV